MPEQTPTQRLLDHLLPGGLDSYISAQREAGVSWRRIALTIRDDFGVDVTFETLRSWFVDGENGENAA